MTNTQQLHLGACLVGGKLYATVMDRDAKGYIAVVATAEIDETMLRERDCLAEMRAAQQWQPIETAPKDGTIFLIGYGPNVRLEGSRRVYEARWHDAQARFTSVNGFLHFDGANFWQPLPAAPEFQATA